MEGASTSTLSSLPEPTFFELLRWMCLNKRPQPPAQASMRGIPATVTPSQRSNVKLLDGQPASEQISIYCPPETQEFSRVGELSRAEASTAMLLSGQVASSAAAGTLFAAAAANGPDTPASTQISRKRTMSFSEARPPPAPAEPRAQTPQEAEALTAEDAEGTALLEEQPAGVGSPAPQSACLALEGSDAEDAEGTAASDKAAVETAAALAAAAAAAAAAVEAEAAAKAAAEKEAADKAAAEAAAKQAAEAEEAEKAAAAAQAAKEAADREAAEVAAKEAAEKEAAEKEAADKAAAERAAKEVAGKAAVEEQASKEAAEKEAAEQAAKEAAQREEEERAASEQAAREAAEREAAEKSAADEAAAAAAEQAAKEAAEREAVEAVAALAAAAEAAAAATPSTPPAASASRQGSRPGTTTSNSSRDRVPPLNMGKLLMGNAGSSGGLKASLRRSMDSPRSPSTPGGMKSSMRRGDMYGTPRDPAATARRAARLMSHKPSSVMFPKREESTVARKDEMTYGLNLGKAPVGSDLKGAPAAQAPRIKLVWTRNPENMAAVKAQEQSHPNQRDLAFRDPEGQYTSKPYWAEVSDAWYETPSWSDRKVLVMELYLGDSGLQYEAGDAVSIRPNNPPELVTNLLRRLKLSADDVFQARAVEGAESKPEASHLPTPCTVGNAFLNCVDIVSPARKSVLRMLAEHCSDSSDKRTLMFFTSKAGQDAYQHEILEHQPSLLDLLTRFPSCQPPLDALLDTLPPLAPRLYAITTSQKVYPDRLQVALSVVRFKTRYGTHAGVASSYLERLVQPIACASDTSSVQGGAVRVPIQLHKSVAAFRHPEDLSTPLIMVGPGTGVGAFRAFLQQRRAMLSAAFPGGLPEGELPGVGQSVLYFGCRREDEDFLYRDDLEGFVADRTLGQLKVAYTRAKAEKVFVHDLIRQDAGEVGALLEAGARVFLCGDGADTASKVQAALVAAVKQRGGLSDEEAAAKMEALVAEGRFVRDMWSATEVQ